MGAQSIGSARTYAFVGFIFYALSSVAGLVAFLGLLVLFILAPVSMPTQPRMIAFPFFGVVSMSLLLAFIPGIVLTYFAWLTVRDIDRGSYGQARSHSLILGIIGIFFGVLPGIFFLLAHFKLSESMAQLLPQRFCVNCGRAVSPDARFCSHCGKELPQ